MKIRRIVTAVDATTDDGARIGGPWPLPLDRAAQQAIRELAKQYGPVMAGTKEQPCSTNK